jgi:endonuclease YncB( thermonuclease family)
LRSPQKRPALAFSLALAVALLAAACAPRSSIYADNQAAETHEVRVVAADHLVIDGVDFILADAEAPKPGGPAECSAEAIAGSEAAESVHSLLAGARHLEVRASDQGEAFRLVNVDGLDLGQALIARGLAVARRPVAMDWCLRARPAARTVADHGN